MSCNSIVLIVRSSRDLSFLSPGIFVCCIFCYNHSFQNRNCVFDEALGLLIRFKLYVLKTKFIITYIGETMIFSSIMHIDNLHIILISKKVFYIKKRLLKYE